MSLANKLEKWSDKNLITTAQVDDILAFEKKKGHSRLFYGLGGLGILSIILGIASLIAANWYKIPTEVRIGGHLFLNLALAAIILFRYNKAGWIRESLVALQAGLVLTFIALIGQTLQTQAPLWQPLGLWLLLATPMLMFYSRATGTILAWTGIFAFTLIYGSFDLFISPITEIVTTALPFILFFTFTFKKVKTALEPWTRVIQAAFAITVILVTSIAQTSWSLPLKEVFLPAAINTMAVGVVLCLLLNLSARGKLISFWAKIPCEACFALLISFLFTIAPITIVHSSTLPALGALTFSTYWLFIGMVGLRLGVEKLWTLAIVLVGLRIFVAYIEIMGTLAVQGAGFIGSGIVFLVLAAITRKLIQKKPKWLTPQTGETGA